MDVPTDGDRSLDELSVGLVAENLFSFLYYKLHMLLRYWFERSEVFYYHIEVLMVLAHFFTDLGLVIWI